METPEPLYGYGYGGFNGGYQSQYPSQSQGYETPTKTPQSKTTGFFELDVDEVDVDFTTSTTSWSQSSTEFESWTSSNAVPHNDVEVWAWTWDRTVKAMIFSPIVIFTILGNLLVLYAFITRKRDLRSPTHFFIANLSLADFFVGILAMPFLATLHVTDRWYFGPDFCYAWVIIHFWLCSASILSTLAVCIERYIGVKHPLRHVDIMNIPRVIAMMLGVWGLAGFLSLISVLAFPEPDDPNGVGRFGCRLNNQLGHVLIATIGILYIPAGLMIFLYWRIYVIASTHLKAMKGVGGSGSGGGNGGGKPTRSPRPRSKTKTWSKLNFFRQANSISGQENSLSDFAKNNSHTGENSTEESGFSSFGPEDTSSSSFATHQGIHVTKNSATSDSRTPKVNTSSPSQSLASLDRTRKQINLARKLSFLVGILLASYIPFFTAFLIRAFDSSAVPNTFFTILGWIRYSNSALNPIIYALAVPGYRKAFQNILNFWKR